MSLDKPVLRARKPTARVPWPFVLVEGEEKAGKSWLAALLSTSDKVGVTYWLDLGEGAGDEYGAIPGARYEVLEHDGTYAAVLEQVLAVKAEAQRAADAGEPPVVLVLDSATAIWEGLKDWVGQRARNKPSNKAKLAADPAAELDVSRNLWNDAGNRYRRLATQLLTFPGIVIATARGKVISATDPNTGQPFKDGRKDYAVESHRTLPYDATVWLRLFRTSPPQIIGARSVYAGVKPGADEPVVLAGPRKPPTDNVLEWLVFEVLRCDPGTAHTRDLKTFTAGDLLDEEREEEQRQEARAARERPATREPQQRPEQPAQPPQERPATPPRAQDPAPPAPAPQAPPQAPQVEGSTVAAEGPPAPNVDAVRQLARTIAERALESAEVAKVRNTYKELGPLSQRAGMDVGKVDVLGYLGDDDTAALGLDPDLTELALGALLMAVGGYIGRHGVAVRDLGELDGPGEDAPAAPVEDPPVEDPWEHDNLGARRPA